MSEAAILGVIQKLESWVTDNKESTKGSLQTLEDVFDELRMLLDFLRDKKFGEGSRVNYMIADVVEKVEDIMYIMRECDIKIMTLILTYNIESTRDWLRETRIRMINLGVDELNVRDGDGDGDGDGDEDGDGDGDVVGLEEAVRMLLLRAIFSEEHYLTTSLIKGMAGVGKTTLARQVYNHTTVIDRFKHRAWICLPTDLTNKEVLMKLIQHVVGSEELQRDSLLEKMELADIRSLWQMLHEYLQEMPYFIVVDNVCKKSDQVESLLTYLPQLGKSRVLLISRSQPNTGKKLKYIHEMKCLDSYKSWQLFLKTIDKISSEQYKFSKHLEKKGRQMLRNCGGLPVAIIDMGRQKAKQRLCAGTEWEELLEFDAMDLVASLELLESSYRSLDKDLQAYFLYLAFFKENCTIRGEKLGHICAARGLNRLDSPLDDLASESFVEVVGMKRYCVNPLLHRLSIKIAEQEIGFEVLNNNRASYQTSPRHRVINCSRENKFNDHYDSTVNQDKHLVSLIFHGGGSYLDDAYWKSFEQLDIVDLEDFGLKSLSETMGTTLTELKYLGLRNNYIQEIPVSLGCLKKLEVLDIAQNFMVEVPDIIWEMNSLCHIYMSDVICRKPLKIDMLDRLETLTYITVDNWAYDEVSGLEKMNSLRKLGIEEVGENSDASKLFASLRQLENLDFLILRGFRFQSMCCLDELRTLRLMILKLDGLLARLPCAHNFPPFIRFLILINTCLDEDPMSVLEKVPCLILLKLRNAYTGRQMVIHYNGFPALQELCIEELWSLRNVQVGEDAMPLLKQLEINNCPCLESLPEEIGSLPKLKELKMVTTKNIATKIRKSGLTSEIKFVDISP